MSKFVLTASRPSAQAADKLKFHATMSPESFKEAYADKNGVGVYVNPHGNKHPKGYFMAWKDNEGVAYNGAVSNKITTPEEFTNPVISVVSTPDKPEELFVLMHNASDIQDNRVIHFKKLHQYCNCTRQLLCWFN